MYTGCCETKEIGNGQRQNNIRWNKHTQNSEKTGTYETGICWWLVKGNAWQLPGKWKLRSDEELAEVLSLRGVWE